MPQDHFWFVDDEQHVRWAVRVSGLEKIPRSLPVGEPRIYFTSRTGQISTAYLLDTDEQDLSRYEVLELLADAKREAAHAARQTRNLEFAA